MTTSEQRAYVPAAGHPAFTRAYDLVVAPTMRERRWRPMLTEKVLAGLDPGATVVDVGAGTGTQAIGLGRARPDVNIVAIDGDAQVRALAEHKEGAWRVQWIAGLAEALPLEAATIDRVVMTLLLHHLDLDGKRAAIAEARRVLRVGGELHVADWGRPTDPLMRGALSVLSLIDGADGIRDHAAGRLPEIIKTAGFEQVQPYYRLRTAWGPLHLLSASPGTK